MLLLLQASDDTCIKMPSQAESLRQEMHEHINWHLCCHLSFFSSQAEFVSYNISIFTNRNPFRKRQDVYSVRSNYTLCNSCLV